MAGESKVVAGGKVQRSISKLSKSKGGKISDEYSEKNGTILFSKMTLLSSYCPFLTKRSINQSSQNATVTIEKMRDQIFAELSQFLKVIN